MSNILYLIVRWYMVTPIAQRELLYMRTRSFIGRNETLFNGLLRWIENMIEFPF